jgi:DNA-binding MarR family transcriptional regulator
MPRANRHARSDLRAEIARTAAFRTELRRFVHRTAAVTLAAGLTPQRYDLLLMIKASSNGDESSTVSRLSRDLDLKQTAVTELVKRAEEAGLITRLQSEEDRRVFELRLTPEGESYLMRVFTLLEDDRAAFVESFRTLSDRFHA